MHRQEFDQAKGLLQSAHNLLDEAKQAITACSELSNTGFFRDAQKELAEGFITLALVTGKQPPDPGELGIDPAAYLNGLGEAVYVLSREQGSERIREISGAIKEGALAYPLAPFAS
ncbi:unnamed protein product [marine sediment metagenome]|uniref:Uncharacterized protein n=1 Tax=marine sediment metagenome TaxID=412755 RepID=X1QBN8_9ZZZZ